MKKFNNKGFSLIELLISFVAISVLSIIVFRTIITIERRQQNNLAYNDYVVFKSSINMLIQKDLLNKIIEAVEFCGDNCYNIKYVGEIEKEISIHMENNIITYGTTKLQLPKTFKFYRDIEQKEDKFTDIEVERFDSILTFRIPISSNLLEGNFDLIYIYQFDSRINPVRPNI